ncbi:MAG: hypothetical protein QOI13_497 [Paraburkholderia sp.]|jgi:hypothetical protein|nr:hypothetical protein [Paraburkholderia sp.]
MFATVSVHWTSEIWWERPSEISVQICLAIRHVRWDCRKAVCVPFCNLSACLLRVEKPSLADFVNAYVKLQKTAYKLQAAIESVQMKHRYLAGHLEHVRAELQSLLRMDKPKIVEGEALFNGERARIRFSFASKCQRRPKSDPSVYIACLPCVRLPVYASALSTP